jgi:NADH-quinone oxidoreductase subunit F
MEQSPKILTKFENIKNSRPLRTYVSHDGYSALRSALKKKPQDLISLIKDSGLRGRGGAGFPTGLKWSFVPKDIPERYLMCNNDESEPGTFKDRYIVEHSPHMIIEGMVIAAHAIGAKKGYIYTRCEFREEISWLTVAIEEAYSAGFLGHNILGSGIDFDLDHYTGAGAYICGEETGLISSIEGKKGQPKLKPPFPAVSGYLNKPTIVNNTETLAAVPWIVQHGASSYKKIGTEKSPGTKLFCISGPLKKPGVYERALGYPLSKLITKDAGGLLEGETIKGVIPGGISAPILTPQEVEKSNLDYESLASFGSMLGSGGITVIPNSFSIVEALKITADFFHHESCGQCTPCREGTGWLANIVKTILEKKAHPDSLKKIVNISNHMKGRTICALSDAAAMPIIAIVEKYSEEFTPYLQKR